jgi:trehalose 6-phosphate phosphatase
LALPAALEPLRQHPQAAAVFLDFDGTLAPIVQDPALARPLPGVPELLAVLGRRFGVVAVVSGRPASFLEDRLDRIEGVRLVGLYGLDEVGRPAGPTIDTGALENWRPVMSHLAGEAESAAPPGVVVERKDVGFTLHYRMDPEQEGWVRRFAEAAARSRGVVGQEGRMALELRPPIDTDKGTVVRVLGTGCAAACCFGDDLGDLAAFDALSDLAAAGAAVARVAVRDSESPPAVSEAADVVVEGPAGALELLRELVASLPGGAAV